MNFDQKFGMNWKGQIRDHELECWDGVRLPVCSGLCFCFFLFFSFFRFFLASFSSSCLFCFLCFFSCVSEPPTSVVAVSCPLSTSPGLCLCFLCLFLCFLWGAWFMYLYCSGSCKVTLCYLIICTCTFILEKTDINDN